MVLEIMFGKFKFDLREILKPESDEERFSRALRLYWTDLGRIRSLMKKPLHKRTSIDTDNIDYFRNRYQPSGRCPNPLFDNVSKELQDNYKMIHNHICSFLY